MKKKVLFPVVILVVIAILGLVIYKQTPSENKYEETLVTYLEAMREGSANAIAYTAFPNKDIEQSYLASPVCVTDYKVTSSTQINDKLYAFALDIATTDDPNAYMPLYYFVGQQDGNYTVYINVRYVPEALCANLNPNDYSYRDADSLGSDPEFDS